MAPTVVITGATGLLGRWTLRHWEHERFSPVVVAKEDIDLRAPGSASELLEHTRPDVVIHLAWVASGTAGYRSSLDNELWLQASLSLAEACRDHHVTLYCTGSVVDDTVQPTDPYSRAKTELRRGLEERIESGLVGWLRPHYVFDPTTRRPRIVAAALEAAAQGLPVELTLPDAQHDFVHASDVGLAITAALRHGMRGVIEIGSGQTRSVRELVERLGVPWTTCSPRLHEDDSTEPADVGPLLSVGWQAVTTEEFFCDD